MKKNRLKFLKNRPVRFSFGFISLKPKKPNQTKPKPEKTGKKLSQTKKTSQNRAKTKKSSQTGLNRFLS